MTCIQRRKALRESANEWESSSPPLGVLVLGGFAYGGYRRSLKMQADGKSQGLLRSLAPATDTDIIKSIPAGNAAIARHRVAPPTDLDPPEEISGQATNPCTGVGGAGQAFRFNPETGQPCATPMERLVIRRAPPQPVGVVRPATAHEPSAQEKALLEESAQEHAAMVAPTAIHTSEPGGLGAGRESSTAPQNDLSTLAVLSRSLPQNSGNATMPSAARRRPVTTNTTDRMTRQEKNPSFKPHPRTRQMTTCGPHEKRHCPGSKSRRAGRYPPFWSKVWIQTFPAN